MTVERIHFVLVEILKTLGLTFLGVLAVKAIRSLRPSSGQREGKLDGYLRAALYAVTVALVGLGAFSVGTDIAAGIHEWAAEDDLASHDLPLAYANAARAVEMRPADLDYWKTLAQTKLAGQDYASLLRDEPAFRALSSGELDEVDAYRFAVCHYFLGQYDETLALTRGLIRQDQYYAAPYNLEGMTYLAQKNYADAAQTYLELLQTFPTQQAAVEGLAHAYYLMGETSRSLAVLNDTSKYPFSPEARKRFEALKALYAQ